MKGIWYHGIGIVWFSKNSLLIFLYNMQEIIMNLTNIDLVSTR